MMPASSSSTRRFQILLAMARATSAVSVWVAPTRTHSPGPMEPTVEPSLVTDARVTRWTSARNLSSPSATGGPEGVGDRVPVVDLHLLPVPEGGATGTGAAGHVHEPEDLAPAGRADATTFGPHVEGLADEVHGSQRLQAFDGARRRVAGLAATPVDHRRKGIDVWRDGGERVARQLCVGRREHGGDQRSVACRGGRSHQAEVQHGASG